MSSGKPESTYAANIHFFLPGDTDLLHGDTILAKV